MAVDDDLPPNVAAAFGAAGAARRLPGGSGTCWQLGDVVLKPEQDPTEASWLADLFATLHGPGFRVPRPIRAAGGAWVVDGWAAWTTMDGEPAPVRKWPELVAAGRALHQALIGVPPPPWLGRERNPWVIADQVAWGEADVDVAPELADPVAALEAARRPVHLPHQLVHGDISGNVLFADGQPPTVIDFAPYWRPAGYSLAVAAVDILTWSDAPPTILDILAGEPEIDQLLVRAMLFRLVTESISRADPQTRQTVRRISEPIVDLVLSRVSGRRSAFRTDDDIAAVASRVLGRDITGLQPVAAGHSRAVALISRQDRVFVKASRTADTELDAELAVYETHGDAPFLPRLLASTRDPVPLIILEALAEPGWVRTWTAELITATRRLLHDIHVLPAPAGVPRLAAQPNPWDAIAADPRRLLRLNVCTPTWLATHLETLRAAAGEAPTAGDSLIHRDVRAANLWRHDGRLLLVDWAVAAIGNPWLDYHLWLVELHTEGGPPPDDQQGPNAAGHAALIAGQRVLLTPSRDSDPALFDRRRREVTVALSWTARLLHIPPPSRTLG